ncbi:MAG TPA: PDZ domain-containing protein, partial [Thiolapillus brandeum]|nr:PDZ domain-containing protein [Thiolapillus brandeum]
GFAVPVDRVNRVVPQLIAHGRYQRPELGVVVDDRMSRLVTERLGVDGVLVLRVEPGSAAAEAGIRGSRVLAEGNLVPGDIILGIGDRETRDAAELRAALERYRVGDEVRLRLLREGRLIELPVLLQ